MKVSCCRQLSSSLKKRISHLGVWFTAHTVNKCIASIGVCFSRLKKSSVFSLLIRKSLYIICGLQYIEFAKGWGAAGERGELEYMSIVNRTKKMYAIKTGILFTLSLIGAGKLHYLLTVYSVFIQQFSAGRARHFFQFATQRREPSFK